MGMVGAMGVMAVETSINTPPVSMVRMIPKRLIK
jgi:hypothetical protein